MKFQFDYWYKSVGLVGASRTGKSYATTKLLSRADKRCSVLVPYEDLVSSYAPYSDDIKVANDMEYDGKMVDRFIQTRKDTKIWCQVFDDLDIFIKQYNASVWLENAPIASKGHWKQGLIWQSRRVVGLPRTLIQNSDYLIFTWGVDKHDYADLEEYAGLDLELYKSLKPPVRDPESPHKILSAEYLILYRADVSSQEIIKGFK